MIRLSRNRDAAGSSHRFEANGDVHAISEYFVFVGHHISHVNAETEFHQPIRRQLSVALRHQRLDLDGGLDGADDARKFQQETVARVLHEPAAMVEDDRIYRASMSLEGRMRARLVGAHHAGITGDVRADYGGQASLHLLNILLCSGTGGYHGTWSADRSQWS